MARETSGKVLIVYYSLSGNTARVAQDLARMTQGDIESLQDLEHGRGFLGYVRAIVDALRGKRASLGSLAYDPRKYALTIIGTPVWAGHMTPVIRAYLQRFAVDLSRVAFVVTSGNTRASKVVPSMEAILRHNADAFIGFNAADLADPLAYGARIAEFLEALKRSRASQSISGASALC